MEKKEMILFTVNESKYYKNQNVCYICKELLMMAIYDCHIRLLSLLRKI